ncbi:MAG: VIT1/CCC1 transporter family protein [Sphingomonadales bacterium]|nr:VIT1/CCC1 transporter family protein [Sphingomonadales bacterium]MDE2569535.1 VIT1/CCC1 transporter family protein [Sphingomonadales bacterium]
MDTPTPPHPPETHAIHRIGWLRATVLGANDGIVSTASLIVGVAAAGSDRDAVIVAGLAALVAGAMAMAAGEYVSVASQADTEAASLVKETWELANMPEAERAELVAIYRARGLSAELAGQVVDALHAHDALGAHARDELGLASEHRARPVQAAIASAASFVTGAALPLLAAVLLPGAMMIPGVALASLAYLMLLGGLGAWAGGAPVARGVVRVAFWGAAAFAATWAIGRLFGTTVG